jgi:hypothetical protein
VTIFPMALSVGVTIGNSVAPRIFSRWGILLVSQPFQCVHLDYLQSRKWLTSYQVILLDHCDEGDELKYEEIVQQRYRILIKKTTLVWRCPGKIK